MDLETYHLRISELGINRGRLETGFEDYRTAPEPIKEDLPRIEPPDVEIPEHLKSQGRPQTVDDHRAKLAKCSPPYRKLYLSMLDRGVTVASIAQQVGVNKTVVHKALHNQGSRTVTIAVASLLTQEEREFIGWGGKYFLSKA